MSVQKIIEQKLSLALKPVFLELIDKSCGCGTAFDAIIVSNKFVDKRLLDRHRIVNEIIKEELQNIHAFSMKCHTPIEYDKIKEK
ncbi:BolA-like protein, putative [Plasmodium berghei]|uniref:BolA-like protein, putative n=2 Tax=Plasmodium berghei TaxID=5821 RepID=A0A509ANX8_PLABA|nr:BolA-like protein, putative [Plasmodium berghei ANKA]CXI62594.1 BolA-like protein, putative [Plasmodium berghei]SCM23729.1 BolA-like protein, putative [Plasmodium berghei]SCN26745.1 BolA-like protein, putative [Plasmodium berghei]SCO61063.1 BolA-like protein, putative [Plasmodium berghei]SCO63164.1 BolA-like protein, putative [Plasmodium berghei]|eukprot:XP_034422361.1 BolA-like protein, putative [Plasmodium berghei ANKA]